VLSHSKLPFIHAARQLLKEGVDPDTPLIMRWLGKDYDALSSRVGVAADLSISESATRGYDAYKFTKYHPWEREEV
jgi:hypothetical protein